MRLALVTALAAAAPCGGAPPGLPPADVCSGAVTPTAPFTVELGGYDDPFVPWSEGGIARTVLGGQGSMMVVVRTRLAGSDIPACIRVEVSLTQNGRPAGQRVAELSTYAQAGGLRTTKPLYIELLGVGTGDELGIDASVAGTTIARHVFVDVKPDAGP